ncbi:hypothetical protein HOY80DRAFT_952415 [Tuber brumale]|nr:hypothetical protein HOY80DRAFT_952415 [Tuber brumale]
MMMCESRAEQGEGEEGRGEGRRRESEFHHAGGWVPTWTISLSSLLCTGALSPCPLPAKPHIDLAFVEGGGKRWKNGKGAGYGTSTVCCIRKGSSRWRKITKWIRKTKKRREKREEKKKGKGKREEKKRRGVRVSMCRLPSPHTRAYPPSTTCPLHTQNSVGQWHPRSLSKFGSRLIRPSEVEGRAKQQHSISRAEKSNKNHPLHFSSRNQNHRNAFFPFPKNR